MLWKWHAPFQRGENPRGSTYPDYEYPDFLDHNNDFIEFDSYLVPESDLELGGLRMLEVDSRVIIPEYTHTRFVISSGDVIHSWACPALGEIISAPQTIKLRGSLKSLITSKWHKSYLHMNK